MKARDNPFAVDRLHGLRFRFVNDGWNSLLVRLEQLRYRASIVGSHGTGKTTLLNELGERLVTYGYAVKPLRLTESEPRFSRQALRELYAGLASDQCILLDGAEQLGSFAWRQFCRRTKTAGGLIVTSHRAGLLPTLIECRTNAELLADLLQDLLGQQADSVRDEAEQLFEKHSGNLRDVLRALYDRCAQDKLV